MVAEAPLRKPSYWRSGGTGSLQTCKAGQADERELSSLHQPSQPLSHPLYAKAQPSTSRTISLITGITAQGDPYLTQTLLKNGYVVLGLKSSDPQRGAILTASRAELVLRDAQEEQRWFGEQQPTVVVLAAAKGGGITANSPYPTDFLLDNLKIQAAVIETAWRSGVLHVDDLGEACMFAL